MSYIKTKGVIIKEVNTGEADKVVTILSRSHGKISGYAKSARRPKSSLTAGTQFLCYGDFMLFKGRELYNISSCEVIEPFFGIRTDVEKLTYAAHIVDIVNDAVQENQSSPRILQLFLNTLHMLSKTDKSPELIARIFEFRFLFLLGYAPYVRSCMVCESDCAGGIYFSFKKCGFLCRTCKLNDINSIEISTGTARALQHIVYSPMKELFNFELSPNSLAELGRISRRYLKDRLEKEYTKLDFLKSLS